MATGTWAPFVPEQYFDDNGNPLNAGTIETFIAGTSTHLATYSDVGLSVANANPLTLNAAGRPPGGAIFLTPGQSYKFLIKDSVGNTIATPDNISAVPASSASVDVLGTAGEAITAGQTVYLSDGSGGKVAGQWYKGDSANTYSSSVAGSVGMAPNAITAGAQGTIRIAGQILGLSSLTIGADYYIGASGAVTATAPTNVRWLGRADSTSSIVLEPEGKPLTAIAGLVLMSNGTTTRASFQCYDNSVCDVRLTLTSGTPVTTADVTGAANVFITPYRGNRIALYDGSANWQVLTFTELTQALGTLVNGTAYDVFIYNNSGTAATEILEWVNATITVTIAAPAVVTWTGHGLSSGQTVTFTTSGSLPTGLAANTVYYVTKIDANSFNLSTTAANQAAGTFITTTGTQSGTHTGHHPYARQTGLVLQDGVLVKSGATTRRYLGTFCTTSTTQTEDSVLKRDLFNYYNRTDRELKRLETTVSWTYNSVTPHQANASPSNQVELVVGFIEDVVDATIEVSATHPTSSNAPVVGFGLDSTATFAGDQTLATTFAGGSGGSRDGARYCGFPGLGRHILSWNEAVVNSGTAVTFVSNTNSIGGLTTGSSLQSGIIGRCRA